MKILRLLVVIAGLQLLTLVAIYDGRGYETTARADLPNSNPDQTEAVNQLKDINKKMDRLLTVMESGNLEVKAHQVDEKKAN